MHRNLTYRHIICFSSLYIVSSYKNKLFVLDRKKVLRHHPDKKSSHKLALPPGVNEHGYFTCITQAYETLSTITGRQAFDSIDPTFDDDVPNYAHNSKQDFFQVFEAVFRRNARF